MPFTERTVKAARPRPKDYFLRDDQTTGFGVKVTPKGRKSFFAEGRIRGGGTRRVTIGTYPALTVDKARREACVILANMHLGKDPRTEQQAAKRASRTLSDAFEDYMAGKNRKPSTERDYRSCFNLVFKDWSKRPITAITKADVEAKFRVVQKSRGERSANKAFAILSAVCKWAEADDTISVNPCIILKQKKLRKTPERRDTYLSDDDIHQLMHFFDVEMDFLHPTRSNPQGEKLKHGVSKQGKNYIKLLLLTGLRKSEALNLKWTNVNWKKMSLVLHDTKNGRDHYVPLSKSAQYTLRDQEKSLEKRQSPYVFPSRYDDNEPMTEPKSQLAAIRAATRLSFTLHDLRRTFATHASALGVSHDMIKRALNHKSGNVTEGYIVSQIDSLRHVFDKVAEGFFAYANPGLRADLEVEATLEEALEDAPADFVDQKPLKIPDRTLPKAP